MKRALALVVLAACGDDGITVDAGVIDAPPCTCTYTAAAPRGTITAPGASELSGLAASRTLADTLWTHNDAGDTARLYAIGTAATTKGIGTLAGATAVDWEDVATAPCGGGSCIYVADTGDNLLNRTGVRIFEVDEPAQITGTMNLTYRAFDLVYPDGAHDAESLFVDPRDGASYVITKQTTNPSTVYRMPRTAGSTATAVIAGSISIGSGSKQISAADLHTDSCGTKLLVRTADALYELRAGATATIAEVLAADPTKVPVAIEVQGEAAAYLPDGRTYFTVTEGANPTLSRATCD